MHAASVGSPVKHTHTAGAANKRECGNTPTVTRGNKKGRTYPMARSRRSRSPAPARTTRSAVAAQSGSTSDSTLRTQSVLLAAVFLDMIGVALVVPNLTFFWKDVGISPAGLGLVSSVYSSSQLVGGLIIGRLGDRQLSRKTCLLISFAGSGVSYALVGLATNVETLVLSRVLVGLVKQTMTCTLALITRLSTEDTRAQALGRVSSTSTLAFVVGQALGGAVSSRYGRRVPCFVASALFGCAFALVLCALPSVPTPAATAAARAADAPARRASKAAVAAAPGDARSRGVLGSVRARVASMTSTFTSAFRSGGARRTLAVRAAYGFLMRGGYALHSLYEAQRWQLTPADAGYLSTYKTALSFSVDALLVGVLARRLGEVDLLRVALACSAANAALEAFHASFAVYACVNLPLSSMLGAVVKTTLSSAFSKAVPASDAGSALSVLDVLNSAIGIAAPVYGGVLLGRVGVGMQPLISLAHYLVLLVLVGALLERAAPPPPTTTNTAPTPSGATTKAVNTHQATKAAKVKAE